MGITKIENEVKNKELPLVDIGVACYGPQLPAWWVALLQDFLSGNGIHYYINEIHTASSMLKDNNKNGILEQKNRTHFTDVNRVAITAGHMASEAEWMFWIDDDTVIPKGALAHLLSLRRQFVSGLYFLPAEPHNPIAYFRNNDGTYSAFYDYPKGSLLQVDSIGFGCCLVHKDVLKAIKDQHKVMKRPDGSLITIHKSRVRGNKPYTGKRREGFLHNGIFNQPLYELEDDDNRAFPYFQLEYCRTEDHKFCEMAEESGFKPWLDTSLICDHLKPYPFGEKDYHEKGIANINKNTRDKAKEA